MPRTARPTQPVVRLMTTFCLGIHVVPARGPRPGAACDDGDVPEPSQEPVRVDRWLWAARLVKTRALAAEAIKGGRVEVNGRTVKPSKDVGPGDALELTSGPFRTRVVIRGTALRRGPAADAALLYEETEESRRDRARVAEQRRLEAAAGPVPPGRPTKRDRRRLEDARRRRG
jgi:ribosome-associated heat shock protein Hsp15